MSEQFLIVGGDSEIAGAVATRLRARGYRVAATTRRAERVAAVRPFLDLARPLDDWPIPEDTTAACLCAAMARLGDCADDPEGSTSVNVTGIVAAADRLLAHGVAVLFLSTDKVFDGSRAQVPADWPTCPVSEYGRQKAAAEAALIERMRRGAAVAILRLAKIVSPGMPLLRQWLADLTAGKQVRAFDDMMIAPTPAALVAEAVERLLAERAAGIFQLTGPRDVAYSDVALHLARKIGADPRLVEKVSAYSAGLPAGSTAAHTTLDSSALGERFGLLVPDAWAVIDALIETCR
jgi:dTDP-4-dehydrorhamnose reductase